MTKEQAMQLRYRQDLYHSLARNKDGSPLRCRVNGKCKTWKTMPHRFQLPVKHGLRNTFYITEMTAPDWSVEEPRDPAKLLNDFMFGGR